MCLPAAPETGDAIDGSSAVTSTTSVVVTDPAIDSRGRMCCVSFPAYRLCPLRAAVSVSLSLYANLSNMMFAKTVEKMYLQLNAKKMLFLRALINHVPIFISMYNNSAEMLYQTQSYVEWNIVQ